MYCMKCGIQLPDDAVFCYKCGVAVSVRPAISQPAKIIAPYSATSLKCPSCGAPISPKFGEMVITCEYCSNCITLGAEGWKNIQKHTILPLKITDKDVVLTTVRGLMNRGFFRRHLQESSTLEEMDLSYVPYWIVSVSARTNIISMDTTAEAGKVVATAAILGGLAAGMGGGRRGGGRLAEGALLGTMIGGGMGGGARKAFQMNEIHDYPVVALRALDEYQPHDFEFALAERAIFDASKVPKGIKILNGDVSEDDAKSQAKTLVDQLQSQKAHKQYHAIQQINSEIDVGEAELLHVPVWLVRYDHKGKKIILIIDGNSGRPIHDVGLNDEDD